MTAASGVAGRRPREARPLWTCPRCGQSYVTREMWHSCEVVPWESHFEGRPIARELWDVFRRILEAMGPVTIVSTKSRVGFMARVRFCGASPRRDGLRVRFWLKRAIESPRIAKRQHLGHDDWIYDVLVHEAADFDAELIGWLREARAVGDQEHLGGKGER
jgi:hypothetical protein